jgi:hypothetical protein
MLYLAAACAESNRGDNCREYDHASYVHGLLSYTFGNRITSLPIDNAQIKNAAAFAKVFHGR